MMAENFARRFRDKRMADFIFKFFGFFSNQSPDSGKLYLPHWCC